jgi:hypothetical protein
LLTGTGSRAGIGGSAGVFGSTLGPDPGLFFTMSRFVIAENPFPDLPRRSTRTPSERRPA